jgi:ribosomal protein S18 acetylase RimI-like enzyme
MLVIRMKTLDNTIKYYELIMTYNDTSNFNIYKLPQGFHYEFFKPGDENEWIMIHIESGEFTSMQEGQKYFYDFYNNFLSELNKRCIFIVNDSTNEKVGTATISLLKTKEYNYEAAVDWFAIKKRYQGRGLAKPLISKFIEIAKDLGHKKLILHTQTTTWLAAKLYLDYGFEILNKEEITGWSILKTLTNHEKLSNYNTLKTEDIFDSRNIEIEKLLIQMYSTNDFNYSVWYKNELHNVYTYLNGISYEYEYFIEDGKIRLEKIKNKN